MSIQTEITLQDWDAFCRFLARSTIQANRVKRFAVAMAVAAVVAALAGLALSRTNSGLDIISFVAGAAVLMVWLMIITRLRLFRLGPGPGGFILGNRTVSLEAEGLRQVSERSEALYRWPAVRSVAVTTQHIFAMVDANAGIIIPLRAFTSDVERDQFLDEIRRKSARD